MRAGLLLAACVALAFGGAAAARPFSVDDLLNAEEFGQIWVSDDGDQLVVERLIGQAQAAPFDQDVYSDHRRSRLYGARLPNGQLSPLLPQEPGGQTAGPVAPGGARMAVMRFSGAIWEVGVLTFATGDVQWLGLTPELNGLGQTLVWVDDHTLLVATHGAGSAPLRLRTGGEMRRRQAELWAAAEAGAPALHVIGSGRFLSARPKAPLGALIEVDLAAQTQRRLAQGDIIDLALSPDGRRVAALALFAPLQAPAAQKLWVASPERRRNLLLIDRATAQVTLPCPTCQIDPNLLAWSSVGEHLLIHGRRGDPWTGPSSYFVVGPEGLSALETPGLRPVIERTSEGYAIPRAHWWRGRPVVLAQSMNGVRGWFAASAEEAKALTGDLTGVAAQLALGSDGALLAFAEGAIWRLSENAAPQAVGPAKAFLAPQGLGLSYRERVNGFQAPWVEAQGADGGLSLRSVGASAFRRLPTEGKILRRAVGGERVAVIRRREDGVLLLEVQQGPRDWRALAQLNAVFAEIDFAERRPVQARAPQGEPVTHWLFLPPETKGPLPLIVIPYPGAAYAEPPAPYGSGVGRFSANADLFAAAGFAALVPSLPRPPGAEPGEAMAEQIWAAVEAVSHEAELDLARVALVGQSFGGYAALMAATQSDRFAAIVASAAPSDLASMRGAMDPHYEILPADGLGLNANFGWSERGQGGLMASPWEDPDLYARNSPVYFADRICAPVLLIHGDGDFVRLSQAQEMFSALYRLGKDAQLITVFGEAHVVSSPGNRRVVAAATLDWLRAVLGAPHHPCR